MAAIVCTGRPVDDAGVPQGEPCGRVFHRPCFSCRHWDPAVVRIHVNDITERARAAGWRLGPNRADGTRDAMCPSCARPDPAIARGLDTKGS